MRNDWPKRKNLRLRNFDYNQAGYYFVTICAKGRRCIFGKVVGAGVLDGPQIVLSDHGKIVLEQIEEINRLSATIKIDKFVIMPNHIHLIVVVNDLSGQPGCGKRVVEDADPYGPVGRDGVNGLAETPSCSERVVEDADPYGPVGRGGVNGLAETPGCSERVVEDADPYGPVGRGGANGTTGRPGSANAAVPGFVSVLKRFTNRKCAAALWQRGYYDHVIRDEAEYRCIWQYLEKNPARWTEDEYYCAEN